MKKEENAKQGGFRSYLRAIAAKGGRVEFKPSGRSMVYQFGLRDWSDSGLGIIVHKDSAVLGHLKVGQVLALTLHQTEGSITRDALEAEIRHISEPEHGQHPNHKLVGLHIIPDPT